MDIDNSIQLPRIISLKAISSYNCFIKEIKFSFATVLKSVKVIIY